MSWNIGDKGNLFLKLKTKLGLFHVELKSKDSPEKNYANSGRILAIARY